MAPDLNPRAAKAISAMRALGISDKTVKPVLRRLFRLYGKKWELIEEDNYRALADAIFESEEEKLKSESKDQMINEDSGPPFKKPNRGGDPADQVSSTEGNSKSIVDLEESEVPQPSSGIRIAEPSSASENFTSEPRRFTTEASSGSKQKDPVKQNLYHVEENSTARPKRRALYLVDEPDDMPLDPLVGEMEIDDDNRKAIVLREEHPNDSSPQFAVPTSPTPEALSGSMDTSQHLDTRKKKNGSTSANQQTMFQTTYDIASSTNGQVKVSLTCNHAVSQKNLQIPSADEVLSFVESISQKFCKTAGDQFSQVKLLNELCEYYSKMVFNSHGNHLHCSLRSPVDSSRKDRQEDHIGKRVSNVSGSSVSRDLVIARPQLVDQNKKKRALHRKSDITNGTEKVKISLLGQIGSEDLPSFVYSSENTAYESAYVHISLARIADDDCCSECVGDCLSSSIPCACTRTTGGEFAYTQEGLLDEKFLETCISMKISAEKFHHFYCQDCPFERAKCADMPEKCKGHLSRKFIKECWRKCGCNMLCGNRVVQRGITRKLQVFSTGDSKGWGLRTLEELPKGAFICEYIGEILTNIELYERNTRNSGEGKHFYPVLLDADWSTEGSLKDEEALCLDATYYGNVARFINHRCFDGNLIEIPVQVETPDRHYYHVAFFTKRKVDALEELTWDYGIEFDDDTHPVEAFQCSCGSKYCRDSRKGKTKLLTSY